MKNHYSYRVYADPKIAQTFDRERFGSAVGEFLKQTQEDVVFGVLPDVTGWHVIDVGAGTGRFTLAFLERGARVTACDASHEMLKVLQSKTSSSSLQTHAVDAQELTFPDQTYDCAVSFRMLMHVVDWRKALSEICRVSKDWVVIDHPANRGFLRLTPVFHLIRKPFRRNLQTYKALSLSDVESLLSANGFRVVTKDHGFFFPIIVHRMLRNVRFSRSIERLFSRLRLTPAFGSPVTIFARRIR